MNQDKTKSSSPGGGVDASNNGSPPSTTDALANKNGANGRVQNNSGSPGAPGVNSSNAPPGAGASVAATGAKDRSRDLSTAKTA